MFTVLPSPLSELNTLLFISFVGVFTICFVISLVLIPLSAEINKGFCITFLIS